MLIAQSLLAEFEDQAPVTRRFLERLPDDRLMWQPHPRSMTAGQLAYHLASRTRRRSCSRRSEGPGSAASLPIPSTRHQAGDPRRV